MENEVLVEEKVEQRFTSSLKAIRAKCLDCCESANAVRFCPIKNCALYPFRFGKGKPRNYTEESKLKLVERCKAMAERYHSKNERKLLCSGDKSAVLNNTHEISI